MSALSPEYRTLQKNASKIVDVVAHQCDVTLFSRKLVENDLISGQSANNIVQTMGHSDYNKVSQLMQAVESQIRTASNTTATFETFMQILREIPLDQLADQLADFYKRQNPGYRGTFFPQGGSGPSPSTSSGTILVNKDLAVLIQKLTPIAYQWYQLGIQLEFDPGTLKGIHSGIHGDAARGLDELLTKWLQRTQPPATFKSLVDVVGGSVICNQVLAEQLKRECGDFPSIKGSVSGAHSTIGTTAQGTTAQAPGMAHHLPQQTDEELSETDMVEISTYLGEMEAAKILNLGMVLGLSYINLKNKMKSETFLLDVIHSWLQKEDQVEKKGKPTWRNLVNALRSKGIGQTGIADQIARDKGLI